jgi:uncharacterized protein
LFPADLGLARVEVASRDVDGDTPLHVVVWRNDEYAAKLLLEAGAEPNAVGDIGATPLHVAVRARSTGLVRLLLLSGADPNIRCEFGDSAFERADAIGGELAREFRRALKEAARAR